MDKRLFLLDGMALAYRAHFAFIARPIRNSKGVNTSALFGFASTILNLVEKEKPTHLAVVFDTAAPTERHGLYPEYKANRDEMPEDLSQALPELRRFAAAFGIPVISKDGFEADDIIGTLARQAASDDFTTYMVTPDKDFGQLVSPSVFIYKPGAKGEGNEILGVPEVLARWEISQVDQVIDMLGLIGDTADNIPGVPGIGPKTAVKLVGQYGSLENLLAHAGEVKGRMGQKLTEFAGQARLSKKLATIDQKVPLDLTPAELTYHEPNLDQLRELLVEFEFRTLAKRALGAAAESVASAATGQGELALGDSPAPASKTTSSAAAEAQPDPGTAETHRTIRDVEHRYEHITTDADRRRLAGHLGRVKSFCFDTETDGLEPRHAALVGVAFAWEPHRAYFVRTPLDRKEAQDALEPFRAIFADPAVEKVGHNLKFDLAVLKNHGIDVAGPLFDTMLAHTLVEPEQRHGMDYLSEVLLDYTPVPLTQLIGDEKKGDTKKVSEINPDELAEYSAEDADVTWQLRAKIEPLLAERGQERVYRDIEGPLVRVLMDMEFEGIALDIDTLAQIGGKLAQQAAAAEASIVELAGRPFNLNSPKQLGEILFDELKLAEKPKKTRTGQYATNEQTLITLANRHPIVQAILGYRETVKLKSTYIDALPTAVDSTTKRVHTHFTQLRAATGRLASDNPNLQNIPIRSAQGREIRRAFVPRNANWLLLSADYSQIELRIIAAISKDPGMIEAFARGDDIHTATAAKVFGVEPAAVTRAMRAKAKMVNFGIPYGISAFGLAQRLNVARSEAQELIDGYFAQFGKIRDYVESTKTFCRENGYVETLLGRRRYLPDINSGNGATRSSAERNAINMPIQGTAADMIKIAMTRIHDELQVRGLRTRLLLQVHDELLFELHRREEDEVRAFVTKHMQSALPLGVPVAIEMGTGSNWLEAH